MSLPVKGCCASASASADVRIEAAGVRVSREEAEAAGIGPDTAAAVFAVRADAACSAKAELSLSKSVEDGLTAVVHEIGYVPLVIATVWAWEAASLCEALPLVVRALEVSSPIVPAADRASAA